MLTDVQRFVVSDFLAAASAETGLMDFGDEEFREGLEHFVESTNNDVRLTPTGAAVFHGEIHGMLVNRLRFADDLKTHPEILDEELSDPIIVMGLPRTGTTKLQRMLATDPGLQSVKVWQTIFPARFPGVAPGAVDPRIDAARQAYAMLMQLAPDMNQIHPSQISDPEEEIFLQLLSFRSLANYMAHPAHGYYRWAQTQSLRGTYAFTKQMLQYLQWQDGGRRDRPWILKTPVHIGNVDLLNEHFPKATYVFTHRDVQQVVPSFCRLVETFWRVKTDAIDPNLIGQFVMNVWADEMSKHLALRDRLGARIQFYDVPYVQVKDEAVTVIREIYRRACREFVPAREQAIKAWEADHAYARHGRNHYTLAQYGLTGGMIDQVYLEYRRRFAAYL